VANHLHIGHGSAQKITPVFHIAKWAATQCSANYCDMLKAAIQSKYQGQLLEGVLFLHKTDNPQSSELLKSSGNCTLRCWNTLRIAQT